MRNKLGWVPYIGAGVLLALGLVLLFASDFILLVFPALVGTIMLLVGAWGIGNFVVLHDKMMDPSLKLVQSVVTLIVGVVFLVKRDVSMAFLAILFGMYALVSSGINLSSAVQARQDKREFRATLAESIFGFILGALLLFAPFSGRDLWARFLGVYFLVAAAHGFYWTHKITQMPTIEDEDDEEEQV